MSRLFTLPSVVLRLLAALLLLLLSTSPLLADAPQHLKGWEYRWGDSPFNAAIPEWTQAANPEDWQAIDFPSNPPQRQGQTWVWYRTQLPDNTWEDPVIYIYSIDLLAEFYLDGEKIYQFGQLDAEEGGSFQGWPWHLIELPADFSGKELYVRVYSDYTDIGLWGEVKLLERSDLLLEILDNAWLDLLVAGFCGLMALVAFAFAAMQPHRQAYIYLGLLTLSAGALLLGENQAVQLVIQAPLLKTYLAATAYFALPLFITRLLACWLPPPLTQHLQHLAWVHLVYLLLAPAAALLGLVQLSITYPVFDLLFTLSLLWLLLITGRHFRRLNSDQRLVMLAYWILAAFLLVDMAIAHGFLPWGRFPLAVGVLIFALAVMLLALREYQHTQARIRQLNATLEERVKERTSTLQTYAQLERQRSSQLGLLNRYSQELEGLVSQLQGATTLEEATDYLIHKLPQLFQPYQVSLHLVDDPGPSLTGDTSSAYQWPLILEDLNLGARPFARLQLNPDASLSDQQQLQQLDAFMNRVSERLAMTLTGIKIRQDLHRLSYEDALTGLKNRRFLDDALDRELTLAKRNKTSLSILICDIDHFKFFNDNFGHDAGDMVLRTLASVLLEHFRETDLPCRFGGEEFVVIMPGANAETAARRAEELRQKVAARPLAYQGEDLGQITISLGIACWPGTAQSSKELLKQADKALYQAKQAGRNQVKMAIPA
ncbi:GGDEF domain-containing protein [Marinospirillum perlucidum]|uniref:GGDEF domain-containing protein n=1 Tax=Marinospirillum perlucidum TaxID=1982602 RepID=UPI000DF27FC5|nr:GGDEF domain-containing protein [Marinospirillum perlucidum]